MKADNIINIIDRIDDLSYDCILFDGVWGIGKTYAINKALEGKENVCKISMFGLQNSKQIYHEALFQLLFNNKACGKIGDGIKRIVEVAATCFEKIKSTKDIVETLVEERELFLMLSNNFESCYIIVIDDLERISGNINLQEVLGIIEELKQCNYVKIVLIANVSELSKEDNECLLNYQEKVIDRVYHITERPDEITWSGLGIDVDFITDFFQKHKVKNLRTLQKAQNFFDDVKTYCDEIQNDKFLNEVRLVCFAIVVEDTDNLYYKKSDETEADDMQKNIQMITNDFMYRVSIYLRNIKSGNGLCNLIYGYYKNETELEKTALNLEYEMFLKAGDKPNFYKTVDEIKRFLSGWKNELNKVQTLVELNRITDEYIGWCNIIEENSSEILKAYKERIHYILGSSIKNDNEDILNYDADMYHISTNEVKNAYNQELENQKIQMVNNYIEYLQNHIVDKKSYEYSYKLKRCYDSIYYKEIINHQIEKLFIRNSFPIDDMNENKYYTCFNIMYILYHYNSDMFQKYCDKFMQECDCMAKHRIKTIVEKIKRMN